MNAEFPEKLSFLFQPKRYKVAYGGRGSSKSWSVARALLILAAANPTRVLCTREVQKSIKDSVHRLLSDQIAALGLSEFYDVLETEIRGRNGSLFLFAGLSTQTVDSIKSYEGVDICWCEEAHHITKRSWNVLIPTIRKETSDRKSEIWVTFNPELDTDETYVRFVENPPEDCISVEVNYCDNPWFPSVLEQERLHCKITNEEDYSQIWEGKCRSAVSGAIYAKQIAHAVTRNQICNVPYDPRLKAHTIWDLGWNDSMSIIIAQRLRSEIRIIEYIEDSHKKLDWYLGELHKKNLNWGYDWIPHDGTHKDFKTGKSTEELIRAFGRKPKIIPNVGVEEGIKIARMAFDQIYFDKEKTKRLIECLKRYRRHISTTTNEPGHPVHDEFSHGADDFRYLGVVADKLVNNIPEDQVIKPIEGWEALDSEIGY